MSLIIPLRDVAYVAQVEAHPEENTSIEGAISFSMKLQRGSRSRCIVFANLPDRSFVVGKVAEMLSKLKVGF